jgi:hypothetical protein
MKMLAASHAHGEAQVDALRQATQAGFEAVAKAIKGLVEQVASQPQGRKSVARVISHPGEVEKTEGETDVVAKAETALDALKALNEQTYGIR